MADVKMAFNLTSSHAVEIGGNLFNNDRFMEFVPFAWYALPEFQNDTNIKYSGGIPSM